jgi:hypothetical protein
MRLRMRERGKEIMIAPAKEWTCDRCATVQIQTGVRALELIPTPPDLWTVVDTTRILPPRVVGEGANKVKVGATRQTTRQTYCPTRQTYCPTCSPSEVQEGKP